jgi:hypothetical protein
MPAAWNSVWFSILNVRCSPQSAMNSSACSRPLAVVLLAAILSSLVACGDRSSETPPSPDPPVTDPSAPAPAPAPAPPTRGQPAPTVTLPLSGDITTGALTPSSESVRVPSEEEKQRALDQVMNRLADQQAAGLRDAKITVNAAWPYEGYSMLSPNPASAIPARMVAIDLTVSGHTAAFDPDDIEIVDGITLVSYGSDPHLSVIRGPGEVITDPKAIPVAPAPIRLLLIYAFPKGTKTFTLFYWGQKLLDQPRGFDAEGWGLPYPAKTEAP